MKKFLISAGLIAAMTLSCTSGSGNFGDFTQSFFGEKWTNLTEKEQFKQKMASYDIKAKIVTNKGDINIFLYPDAAPETVANFLFLVENGFYDNMTFSVGENNLYVQTGDPAAGTKGDAGYTIPNEFDSYLTFDNPGMLAMVLIPGEERNTASSQFLITEDAIPNLNHKLTVFGSLVDKNDMETLKKLKNGDRIEEIIVTGKDINNFLKDNFKKEVDEWSKKLIDFEK